jgi:hypothetical protein
MQKYCTKLTDEKMRLARRERLLSELKAVAIDSGTAKQLKSVVTSNGKSKKKTLNCAIRL